MRQIPLSQGKVALVDDEDYEELAKHKWTAHKGRRTFYAVRNERLGDGDGASNWRLVRMHSQITGWPQTDHANGNGLDNQRSNLRPASSVQNGRNRRSRLNCSSRYLGVSLHRGGKWTARIKLEGKYQHLGLFEAEEDAARAYDRAALERDPEFCNLNFPQERDG